MKQITPYRHFPSFVLRSPLFPFDFINDLVSGPDVSEEKLKEVCRIPAVDEALFLASPDLHGRLHRYLSGGLTDPKKIRRLHYALMRYILRMSTRPTPFGLFAGFNVGHWEEESLVRLPPAADYTRHTRLDMNYLCALAQDLASHPEIKEKIKYYPNSSIYPVGNQLRYVEYRYRDTRRTHHIVAVDYSDYLQRILNAAADGAYLRDLAPLLVDDDITLDEAREFIGELTDSQILVNELEPAITGPEFLDQILAVLQRLEGVDSIRDTILRTRDMLAEVDGGRIGTTVSHYRRIAENLEPLGTTYELKFLFQTDMVKPRQTCTLSRDIAGDVLKGLVALNRLTPKPTRTNLTQFRDAFQERYETREIPLLHALDTEAGVGYRQTRDAGDVAPLVDDLAIPSGKDTGSEIQWNPMQSFILKKYREALAAGKGEVELTDKDLEPFEPAWDDLPDTLSTMVQIIGAETIGAGTTGPRVVLGGFGGSGAGNLLGRFCHADAETDAFVREITRAEGEMNPDAIMAEIIHLPESRVGNVLLRPVLRDHEIPYLARAAVPRTHQLKLEDLMVSVRGQRVVLRSKSLDKQIIPRLTNAHNFSYNALPVYHFLADLQTQGLRSGIGFNWGAHAAEFPFLPRVVYRNLVFSPAQWNITREDIDPLLKIKDDTQLADALRQWREERRMPARVLLTDSDNKLFIDLDNIMCIRTLFSVVKNRGGFQLTEFLFDPADALVKGPEGVFTNEFVFCFYNDAKGQRAKNRTKNVETNTETNIDINIDTTRDQKVD